MKKNIAKVRSAIKLGSRGRKNKFFNPSPLIPKLAVDSRKPCNIALSTLSTESPLLAL